MINKWKAKIVQMGLYNRRNPPWREDSGINREGIVAISRTPVTILIQYLLEQRSSDCAENKLSLINSIHLCLIVVNTILTVIHALKPSSLTHFLQIYCTGLTGPRSHTPWAWVAKRVPTTVYFKNLTNELLVIYALNTHVKSCANWILFTILFISLYFMYNFKLQKLAILTIY